MTTEVLQWEISLLEALARRHQELHEDWRHKKNAFANGWSLSPWTHAFKEALREIAGDEFECRSSIESCGEFLWDVSWFKTGQLMPEMVCEIEWGGHEAAVVDFKKLLATSSDNAIMIFDSPVKTRTKEDFNRKIEPMLSLIPQSPARRFIFIYASATGAVDNGEPRIHAKSIQGDQIREYSIDKDLNYISASAS